MTYVFSLIVNIIFGVICTAIAGKKGRSQVGWFFGGFFLGIIGIVIIAVIGNLNDDKKQNRDTYILKEQLRQERIKNESFRQHSTQRLNVHDDKLGINTKNEGNNSLSSGIDAEKLIGGDTVQITPDGAWFLTIKGEESGPFSFNDIVSMIRNDDISKYTLIKKDDLHWKSISSYNFFIREINNV